MAKLEDHVFKRDNRFLIRLVLVLAVGTLVGVLFYAELTGNRVAGCAANAFGTLAPDGNTH